ncbi:hypothetical protein P280DRAFT_464468 [Massarina eburnea CBS 473.64]|uniref:Utp8 beta-propeller domain-containing protein n=1 Tax=Massarina eburnea CBS 473.64 TaxID=1395130 RepID=A0A6A6SH17_9PLEO|nr:hypothetical protein P280DRAFT_464468 [Massarina eburnea CBS 473.64]
MSSFTEIEAPFTLASLPHAIGQSDGRPHAASVCSISGIKKRKRTEIAVAIDGEGISIYSLQNPHLATSYALPPQTSFASAPFSIYRKGNSKKQPRRYTYALVKDSSRASNAQLVCFTEEARKDGTTNTVRTAYTPSDASHKLMTIDALPVPSGGSQEESTHDVVCVFDNADVICLSSDLEVVRWVANLKSLALPSHASKIEIEHASFSTAKAVTHGLLRNRQDISAILNPAQDDQSDLLDLTQVLCVVFRQSSSKLALALFQVSPRAPDLLTSHLLPLKHLVAWDLPIPSSVSLPQTSGLSYALHANTGALHLLHHGSDLLSFDFSATIPKLLSILTLSDTTAFLRISQDLLFAASPKACRLLDAKFTSVQAEVPLGTTTNPTDPAVKDSKKRKHPAPEPAELTSDAPALIAYYVDLGLVVGTRDSELVAFQLKGTISRKKAKKEGMRLIDSLGKGIKSEARGNGLPTYVEPLRLDRAAKLDKYASKGDVVKFEELIAADLGIDLESEMHNGEEDEPSNLVNGNHATSMVNGVGSAQDPAEDPAVSEPDDDPLPRKWKASGPVPDSQRLRYRQYALYALSRIFRWIDSPSSQGPRGCLKVVFFPPNLFEWLLQTGYLTKESIRRAILNDPTPTLGMGTPIRDGDIVRAIVDFDSELHILSSILNYNHFLPVGEVVQALQLLMQTLDDQPKTQDVTRLLTNGTEPADDTMDIDIASEMEAADNEVERAFSLLNNGLVVRSGILRPALIRLHAFPSPVVSSTLRSMLPRHDLESLIRLLHHEFRNGGWTSPYDFAGPDVLDQSTDETEDSAVAVIASLLSCTLDAMGPATWLTGIGGPSSDERPEELIFDLLEDTKIALNGFWEATYIRGLVSELLRYASRFPKSQKPSNKSLQNQGKPFAPDLNPDELPMLPLGAKPDLGVEKTKTKGGKKKERSAREMGMLISKRVPKYSFERIVI